MNEASERMTAWLDEADEKRATACLRWLRGHLATGLFDGSHALRDAIDQDAAGHLRLLASKPSMCKAIEEAGHRMHLAISRGHAPDDIRLVQTIACMHQILRLGAGAAGASQLTLDALDVAHEGAMRQALVLAHEQIDGLCSLLLDVKDFLGQLAMGESRFVLIEMPSGNSVPVKLLAALLSETSPRVETVRAALSRKHPKGAGITRRALLGEQLESTHLQQNDVLVYLDEWETGSNFNTICDFLRKLLPSGAFLFPAAFQSDAATQHQRHASFCAAHDKLMRAWGIGGETFRRLLPPLPSSILGGYFLWSEHDRTAGYRKMQLHGSLFSSFEETIELLHNDGDSRRASAQIVLGGLAADSDLPGDPSNGVRVMLEQFEDSYQDYLRCRDELRCCADEFAKGGEIQDFETAMEPIHRRYHEILNDRKAKLAVCMALAYQGRVGSLDPADRYHFDDECPVLMELDGPAAATHRVVMDVMSNRLAELGHSA